MQHSPNFLIVHSQYDNVIVAIASASTIIEQRVIHKHAASSQLISIIDEISLAHQLSIHEYDALIAHAGPGPFTTLRVALATINGCGLGTDLPLIGVNGLQALGRAHGGDSIILLNAFCEDVYFAIIRQGNMIESGSAPLGEILPYLHPFVTTETQLIGNGVIMHRERILATFGSDSNIPEVIPFEASIEHIAQLGYQQWLEKRWVTQIIPVYLKAYSAHMPV